MDSKTLTQPKNKCSTDKDCDVSSCCTKTTFKNTTYTRDLSLCTNKTFDGNRFTNGGIVTTSICLSSNSQIL